jgi:hypothetical protein
MLPSAVLFFSWYFGGPVWFIISWITNIPQEIYEAYLQKIRLHKER